MCSTHEYTIVSALLLSLITIAGTNYIHDVIFQLPSATLQIIPTEHPHNVPGLIPALDTGTWFPTLLFLVGKLCLYQLTAGMGGTYFTPWCICGGRSRSKKGLSLAIPQMQIPPKPVSSSILSAGIFLTTSRFSSVFKEL